MRSRSDLEDALRTLAASVAADRGLELVELSLRGSGGRRVLRVDIDRAGPQGVGVTECQAVSQALSAALDDDDDLVPFAYVLEVSSPGIDRPIRSADDIRRNTGRRIEVTARDSEGGQRSYRGRLLGSESGDLLLEVDGDDRVRIPLGGIVSARQEMEL